MKIECFSRIRTKYNRICKKAKMQFKSNEGKRLNGNQNSSGRQLNLAITNQTTRTTKPKHIH